MEYPVTSRPIVLELPGWREELLIIVVTLVLAGTALVSPLALPLAVSGVVFVLASLHFKPLLPVVVFFLPITPFLNWDFPIRDLSTLVRFSFFAGIFVYRLTHAKDLRNWLWSGWLTRTILVYFVVAGASAVFLNPLTLDAQRELMRLASYAGFYYVILDWSQT